VKTFADQIVEDITKGNAAESELYEWVMEDVLGLEVDDWPDWNGFDIGVDPVDWDGQSLEVYQAEPSLVFSKEQQQKVFVAGFDVLCTHYTDGSRIRYKKSAEPEECAETAELSEEHMQKLQEKLEMWKQEKGEASE